MSAAESNAPIALVTGAAKRLGRAAALGLARAGMDVALHFRESRNEAEVLAEEIRAMGRRAWTFGADLAEEGAADALATNAEDGAGPIDVLVNNASIYPEDRLNDLSESSLAENIRVNAWVPFALARRVAAQGRPACVVNVLDTRIRDYDARHVAYHLSKRMLFSLTRMMALEYAPRVRVNAIAPGLVLPPPGKSEAYLAELSPTNPLNTHGEAEDVVRAIRFLVEGTFVTGQVIYIDGGRHMLGGLYD